jgi:hypothetical protein
MGERDPGGGGDGRLQKLVARVGLVASALAVFTSGWLAARSSDWKRIVLFTLLAGVAAFLAQTFSRRAR